MSNVRTAWARELDLATAGVSRWCSSGAMRMVWRSAMPELPDLTLYVECLRSRLVGQKLDKVRIAHPFVLRTFEPPMDATHGKLVRRIERLGKRLVISLEDDLAILIHLMIAGRLRWSKRDAKIPGRVGLTAFDFASGTLILTEAGTQRRASVHLVSGAAALEAFRRGGVEPLESDFDSFASLLRRENHTLKRALTDPDIVSGVGNAYSDEILHRARLSPLARTQSLSAEAYAGLYAACRSTLSEWIERLRDETGDGFPEQVTAFHPAMAAHGRFGQPCPICQTKIQRIRYASNECNYCPTCQTEGRLLADRSLSRLLRGDWPKTLEELEEQRARLKGTRAAP